jgi:hypothetical protein
VCPYCNRQYIHTVRAEGNKTGVRAELDHFYAKSIYPFLAVSFANLVPSCTICNSRRKRDRDFYAEPHLHPYQAGFERLYEFRVVFNDYREEDWVKSWFESNPKAFTLALEPMPGADEETAKLAKQNIETFGLEDSYNACHKDYASEMLIKARVYNDTIINLLMDSFSDLFPTRESVLRMITGNYVSEQDLDKRVLAKLARDLARDFRIDSL